MTSTTLSTDELLTHYLDYSDAHRAAVAHHDENADAASYEAFMDWCDWQGLDFDQAVAAARDAMVEGARR
jgi:hypothetical protein